MASDIGKKRKISEWDVSEIQETDTACVHGVPVVVSPLKKSRKNASLSSWRIERWQEIGSYGLFDPSLQSEMKKA